MKTNRTSRVRFPPRLALGHPCPKDSRALRTIGKPHWKHRLDRDLLQLILRPRRFRLAGHLGLIIPVIVRIPPPVSTLSPPQGPLDPAFSPYGPSFRRGSQCCLLTRPSSSSRLFRTGSSTSETSHYYLLADPRLVEAPKLLTVGPCTGLGLVLILRLIVS